MHCLCQDIKYRFHRPLIFYFKIGDSNVLHNMGRFGPRKPKGFENLTSQHEALAVWTIHLGQRWISGGAGRNHVPNIGSLAERFLRIAVVSLSQSMQRLTNTPALRKFEGFHWL